MLPAYIRIHDKIKADVDDGTWKIGQRLPSERDLCDTFDVSRMTVRQAITLLVDEGILERKPGSGTFVASSRVKERCVEPRVSQRLLNLKVRNRLVSLFHINVCIPMNLKSKI